MRRAHCFSNLGRIIVQACTGATVIALSACSTVPVDIRPDMPLTAGLSEEAAYVLVVELFGGEDMADTAEYYGGEVLVWEAGDYALLGLSSEPVEGEPGFSLPWEANEDVFTAGGAIATVNGESTPWASGRSTLWAGGRSTLWAGGEFAWMPENTALWDQIGLREAQELAGNLGRGVKVAIIDTGLDLEHPALSEALAPADEWWDFVDNDGAPQDEAGGAGYGHGTSVAGIVRQLAPRATILPIRVLGPNGQGSVADLAAAIDWAVTMGADVINLSLGADEPMKTVDKALKRATSERVFIFTSTGNDGIDSIAYPAREASNGNRTQVEHMVSVTSVDTADVKSIFANFSRQVELAAPGEFVHGPAPELRVAAWAGTSMAAPMAAGAMALALGERLAVDPDELAGHLLASTGKIYELEGNIEFAKHEELGSGRLDVHQFLMDVVGGGGG
jgi:thermitase